MQMVLLLQRLFFLNGEQDLSSFLLVDMGKMKYPTYNCIISEPIFSNRSNLLAYEEVHRTCLSSDVNVIAAFYYFFHIWHLFSGHWSCTAYGWSTWCKQRWCGIKVHKECWILCIHCFAHSVLNFWISIYNPSVIYSIICILQSGHIGDLLPWARAQVLRFMV